MLCSLLLAACGSEERTDGRRSDPPQPVATADTGTTTTPTDDCASGTFGFDGGSLELPGSTLQIPVDALASEGQEIRLCLTDTAGPLSPVWEVTPADLDLDRPLQLTLDHVGDEVTSVVLTPGPEGVAWRNLQATRPEPGRLEAPLYRGGTAWVESDERVHEAYVPLGDGTVDLLFVVDNSCSMAVYQDALVGYFPTVVDTLDDAAIDYHVGVVSTDMVAPSHSGKLREAEGVLWIEPTTPDATDVFTQMASMGTAGSGLERGLGAAYEAIEGLATTANAGFQRDQAALAIVVLSDEPDFSDTIAPPGFATWLEALKVTVDATALYAIVTTSGPNTGLAYMDVANATGGAWTNIEQTSTWDGLLDDVANTLAEVGLAGMPVAAQPGTVEAWGLVEGLEQAPLDPADVAHDTDAGTVTLTLGTLPQDQASLVYLPE